MFRSYECLPLVTCRAGREDRALRAPVSSTCKALHVLINLSFGCCCSCARRLVSFNNVISLARAVQSETFVLIKGNYLRQLVTYKFGRFVRRQELPSFATLLIPSLSPFHQWRMIGDAGVDVSFLVVYWGLNSLIYFLYGLASYQIAPTVISGLLVFYLFGVAPFLVTVSWHRIVAVSHPWLAREHPDPKGDQLRLLSSLIKAFQAKTGRPVLLFIDYMSLDQHASDYSSAAVLRVTEVAEEHEDNSVTKTKYFDLMWDTDNKISEKIHERLLEVVDEDALSKPGTEIEVQARRPRDHREEGRYKWVVGQGGIIGQLYGNTKVDVWCLTKVPVWCKRTFDESGWCTAEREIAANRALDVGPVSDFSETPTIKIKSWIKDVIKKCVVSKPYVVPRVPEAFDKMVESKRFLEQDQEVVSTMYAVWFNTYFEYTKTLDFSYRGWTDKDMQALGEVLNYCVNLRILILDYNEITDLGMKRILRKWRCKKLRIISLRYCPQHVLSASRRRV